MNVIGLCQGSNMNIFHNMLIEGLISKKSKIGIFIADSFYYVNEFESKFENKNYYLLKEWEVINYSLGKNYQQNIEKWIKFFDDSSLWESVLSDRRIIYGNFCKVKQDYKSKFNQNQIINIVNHSLNCIEKLFNKIKPDLIIGFAPVTLIEHLILRYAEKKNIKYFLIRSSKIDNNLILYDNMNGLSDNIKKLIFSNNKIDNETIQLSENYINKIRKSNHNIYEGITDPKHYFKHFNFLNIFVRFASSLYNYFKKIKNPITRIDNHNPNFILSTYYSEIVKLFRSYKYKWFVKYNSLNFDSHSKYSFFPMHTEPEIAIQINGRVLTNQIEVIRNIAMSLPLNHKLIVKEHPRSFGLRKVSYYKKILQIPNVYLCPLNLSVSKIIDLSSLVFTISGSVGLESIIKKKPVILLGYQDIDVFPSSMVRKVHNLFELSKNVKNLLNNHKHDEKFLIKYISSVIKMSKKIDLYSTLLNKKNRIAFNQSSYKENILKLNDLFKLNMYE